MTESIIKNGQDILRSSEATAASAGVAAEAKLITIAKLKQRIPEAIAEEAETWPADLVVIGTHGRCWPACSSAVAPKASHAW